MASLPVMSVGRLVVVARGLYLARHLFTLLSLLLLLQGLLVHVHFLQFEQFQQFGSMCICSECLICNHYPHDGTTPHFPILNSQSRIPQELKGNWTWQLQMEFLIPFSKVKRLTVMKLMAFSIIDYLLRKEMRFRRSANVILLANLIIYNPDPTCPPKSNKGGAPPFWNSPPFSPQFLSKDFAQIVDPPIKIIANQPIFFVRQRKLPFLIRPLFKCFIFSITI